MRKLSTWLVIVIALIMVGGYLLFVRPVGSEIYFNYKTQFYQYKAGKIEFYLVNDNPNNGRDGYFFRVSLDANLALVPECSLGDYDWELRRVIDGITMFSTASKVGVLNKGDYFENKIYGSVFKGMSGSGLGGYDFEVVLTFRADNGCGIGSDNLVITKTMRLIYKNKTAFDVMMSV